MVRYYSKTLLSILVKQAENATSQTCSFVVSQSTTISDLSQTTQIPEMNMANTNNNMEGNSNGGVRASASATTTSYNVPKPISSIDSLGTDTTFKVFRRIHLFRVGVDADVQALKKLIARTLSTIETSPPGDIYLFNHPRLPRLIRMGFTNQNPEMRLAQWRSICSPALVLISDPLSRQIRYPRRLEQLLHSDLKSKPRPNRCLSCNREHQGIFNASEQFALTIVQLWRRWMETEPYDEDGNLKFYWKRRIYGPNSPITKEELYRVLEHR